MILPTIRQLQYLVAVVDLNHFGKAAERCHVTQSTLSAGIAELGYEASDRHLQATLGVLQRCPCLDGCPSCVQSPKCGNGNEPLDKHGAVRLLRTLLAHAAPTEAPHIDLNRH